MLNQKVRVRGRAGAAVIAVLLLAACSSDDGADATTTTSGPTTTDTTAPPAGASPTTEVDGGAGSTTTEGATAAASLTWTDCDDGFECSTLEVPMDWGEPDGETIELALIRMPVEDAEGTVFVNWGGPGAPGTSVIRGSGEAIKEATGGTMQIVSWDPRGLGQSTPISCPEGSDEYYTADPASPEGLEAMIAAVRTRAAACEARYGKYVGLLGTTQGVHDLDAIRAAVGEEKLNFLGLSYGTRVGTVYAAMYPDRVGHMVLDGSLAPLSTLISTAQGDVVAFDAALQAWFDACLQRSPCALGDDPAAGFDRLVADIRANPPVVPGTNDVLTPGLFNQIVLLGVVNFQGSATIAEQLLAEYQQTGDPTQLYQVARAASGRSPEGVYNNSQEIFQFVNCQDWYDRPSAELIRDETKKAIATSPRIGAFALAYGLLPGAGCPYPASGLPIPNDPDLPPILVVGATSDAETPLNWSQQLSATLPNSVLLVSQTFGHTAFYVSECVSSLAGQFLRDGIAPPPATVCPPPAGS